MELNAYALELDAHDRLDAARALAARRRLARAGGSHPPAAAARPALRVRVGAALVRLGTWLQGCAPGAASQACRMAMPITVSAVPARASGVCRSPRNR
jgi:hypothetical protein